MNEAGKEYLTKEKFEALKVELDHLKNVKRKEIADNLEYAKSLGDLSENAEYHEARENQASTEERIVTIETILNSAVIVSDHHQGDTANIGSTVTIKKEGEKDNRMYHIVGSEESNIKENKLSHRSPVGEAIVGKKKGDSFSIKTNSGTTTYTIVDIK
jgi:transcription elongation factor GreA